MPIDTIGNLLFPGDQRWQRRQRVRTLLFALLVGLVVAGAVAAILLWQGFKV